MITTREIFKKTVVTAKKTKSPVYVVGGFVRDFLLEKKGNKDIDFVVEGSGLEFARAFDKVVKEVGSLVEFPDFDTARYVFGEEQERVVVEFAGARSEAYREESRKPQVESAPLAADLARRDFTVNAMAAPAALWSGLVSPPLAKVKKALLDPLGGQKDLGDKVLRTPLDPDETFTDDPLRMLRAVRFAAQLGFAIDKAALEAIHRNRERLKIVSAERVQEELLKLLATPAPSVGLNLMFQTHLLDMVLPEVSALDGVEEIYGHQHKNNLAHTFKVVDNIATRTDKPLLRFAALLHDIGKTGTKKFIPKIGWTFHAHEHLGKKLVYGIGRRLRLSSDDVKYLAKLVRYHQQPIALMDKGITDSAVRRLVVNLGDDLEDLLLLGVSDITTGNPYKLKRRQENYDRLRARIEEVNEKDQLRAFQSPVRGEEIMTECHLRPGPTVGKIKEAIEEAILDGVIPNDYDAAWRHFLAIKDVYLAQAQAWEKISGLPT